MKHFWSQIVPGHKLKHYVVTNRAAVTNWSESQIVPSHVALYHFAVCTMHSGETMRCNPCYNPVMKKDWLASNIAHWYFHVMSYRTWPTMVRTVTGCLTTPVHHLYQYQHAATRTYIYIYNSSLGVAFVTQLPFSRRCLLMSKFWLLNRYCKQPNVYWSILFSMSCLVMFCRSCDMWFESWNVEVSVLFYIKSPTMDSFQLHGLTLIPTWIRNHMTS